MASEAVRPAPAAVDEEMVAIVRGYLAARPPDELRAMAMRRADMVGEIERQFGLWGTVGIGVARAQLGRGRLAAIARYGEAEFDQFLAEIGISHPDHCRILGLHYPWYLEQMARLRDRLTG